MKLEFYLPYLFTAAVFILASCQTPPPDKQGSCNMSGEEKNQSGNYPVGQENMPEVSEGKKLDTQSIVRISRIEVDPDRLEEYIALATECGRASMAREEGVYMMYSMQEKEHPERITILEIYADPAAYERHIKTPHFQKYKQTTLEMVRKLELLDQKPLVPEMGMKIFYRGEAGQ